MTGCDVVARERAESYGCPDTADERFVDKVTFLPFFDERIMVPRAII
jgi:hypothetical protein